MFDFGNPATPDHGSPIGDGVMGGLSRSRLRHDPAGHAVFEGTVSLARGGVFASMRSSAGKRGLAGARECVVEARGDGRRDKLNLRTDDALDGILGQAVLAPDGHGWARLRMAMSAFRARFRGREQLDALPLDPAHLRQVGLMIAEGQAEPFALEIRFIGLA